MKAYLLFCFFLLVSVEVVNSVVYSWILSVNPVDTGEKRERTARENNTNENSSLQVHCKKDRHCTPGKYCHRHNGKCHVCKPLASQCRRNNMCCSGMECVFGICRDIVPRGTKHARCSKERKCNAGLCCAKLHGEPICRPMLLENDDCSVPEGGLDYSLNQKCPCAAGLACKKVKHRHKKRMAGRLDKRKRTCQRL